MKEKFHRVGEEEEEGAGITAPLILGGGGGVVGWGGVRCGVVERRGGAGRGGGDVQCSKWYIIFFSPHDLYKYNKTTDDDRNP